MLQNAQDVKDITGIKQKRMIQMMTIQQMKAYCLEHNKTVICNSGKLKGFRGELWN